LFFRDFVVDKLSELLSRTKAPSRESSSSDSIENANVEMSFESVGPLMNVFRENVDLTAEARKVFAWEKHFGTFGRGITMFR
jgi:hypothetical protein